MPIYKFKCGACDNEFTTVTSYEERNSIKCCICGAQASMTIGSLHNGTVEVYKTVDKDRQTQILRGVGKIMKDRAKDDRQTNEAGEFVEKNGGMRAVTTGYIDLEKTKTIK